MIHLFIGLHWSCCSLCFSYLQPTRTSQTKSFISTKTFISIILSFHCVAFSTDVIIRKHCTF